MQSQPDQSKSSFFKVVDRTVQLPASSVEKLVLHPAGSILDQKYQILGLLGEGGMGAVYHARHQLLNKEVALKTFRSPNFSDEDRMRFQREAQAIARLNHPNIVQVFDFGTTDDGVPYYTMEYLQGGSLADKLKAGGPLSVSDAVAVFAAVCQGLALAHSKGIIHRDLKPANIFLQLNNAVKVMDFGIASLTRQGQSEQQLTRAGSIFGSPLYMSPEQSLGEAVSEQSDIYSFGCTLFESLTGATPFRGSTAIETIMLHHQGNAPRLSDLAKDKTFAPSLDRCVAKMLSRRPEDRQRSFVQVQAELENAASASIQGSDEARSKPFIDDVHSTLPETNSRHPAGNKGRLVLAVGALLVFSLALGSFSVWQNKARNDSVKAVPDNRNTANRETPQTVASVKSLSGQNTRPAVQVSTDSNGNTCAEIDFPPDFKIGRLNGQQFGELSSHPVTGVMRWKTNKFVYFFASEEFMADPQNLGLLPVDSIDGMWANALPPPPSMAVFYRNLARQQGRIHSLDFDCEMLDNRLVPVLRDFKRLAKLTINNSLVDGRLLATLPQMRQLETFSFCGSSHASSAVQALKGNTVINRLILMNDDISKNDLAIIASLPALRELNLNFSKVTDGSLTALVSSKSMTKVCLGDSLVTPASFKTLKAMAKNGLNRAVFNGEIFSQAQTKELQDAGLTVVSEQAHGAKRVDEEDLKMFLDKR